MNNALNGRQLLAILAGVAIAGSAVAQDELPPPLPIEPTGVVESLPGTYPESWFLVHDAGFFHMSDGKVYVIDTAAETLPAQVKGTFNVSLIGNIASGLDDRLARDGFASISEAVGKRRTDWAQAAASSAG